jgi:hypothetical protein
VAATLVSVALAAGPEEEKPADHAAMLASVQCEVAVSQITAHTLKVNDNTESARAEHKLATTQLEAAHKTYKKAEQQASRNEAMAFGRSYLALRNQMKHLEQQNLEDNKHKIQYVKLSALIPDLKSQLNTTKYEVSELEKQVRASKTLRTDLEHELSVNKKKNDVLSRQLPISKQTIDNTYAKDVIGGKAAIVDLELKLKDSEKDDAAMEKAVVPLAASLKSVSAKLDNAVKENARLKKDTRKVQVKIVETAKTNTVTDMQLRDTIKEKKRMLAEARAAEEKRREAQEEQEDQESQEASTDLSKEKVVEEATDEAQIEADQKLEQSSSGAQRAVEQENKELKQQLHDTKMTNNARRVEAEKNAAAEVENIKRSFQLKIQAEKDAESGKANAEEEDTPMIADNADEIQALEAQRPPPI